MAKEMKTITLRFERTIAAPASEVYKAWLSPKVPGSPWEMGDKLILDPRVDGFFYWLVNDTPHYGRFTALQPGKRIQHTWVSPYTAGHESTVTVTFAKRGKQTLMTLVHSGLPDNVKSRAHKEGWTYFMDLFPKQFGAAAGA